MTDDLLLRLAGGAILGGLGLEVFVTTMTMRGGGPVTGRLARALWKLFRMPRGGPGGHRLLSYAGGSIAAVTLVLWVAALWAGWGLVFAGAPASIVDASTGAPADLGARIYFAGFNIFTLGLGDYRPVGVGWQTATVLASASGLVAITLAITYLLPILSQAVSRQALAGQLGLFGRTPLEVARNAHAEGLESFASRVAESVPDILRQGRQHLAYPVLHYFHTGDRRLALPLRLAVLYEGLLLVECGVEPPSGRLPAGLRRVIDAIALFLDSIEEEILSRAEDTPQAPDLGPLAAAGVEAAPQARFEARVDAFARQRRLLRGFVEHDGWSWGDVHHPGPLQAAAG